MEKILFIDSHCHLTDPRIIDRAPAILAQTPGLKACFNAGTDPEDWQRQRRFSTQQKMILNGAAFFPCFGIHPYWVAKQSASNCKMAFATLQSMLPEALALAETGLDWRPPYREARDQQLLWCERQLDLAATLQKPVVLHCVKAHNDLIALIRNFNDRLPAIMIHGFTSGKELAKQYVDLNCTLSIGAKILHSSAWRLRAAVAAIPVDNLVVESDSPDQPPPDFGNRLNEPGTIPQVLTALAACRNEPLADLAASILQSTQRFFGIDNV